MPIEIRELVIKASVANSNKEGGGASSKGKTESAEDAIQEALEQVSEMKRKENER